MRLGSIRCFAMGLLVGCYSPTFPENQPCSETQRCPDGLHCDVGANECVSELPETARFTKISAYDDYACAIDREGALFCWGRNDRSELGLGDTDQRLEPTRVGIDSDWIDIQTGRFVTCGLRDPDQLWCWGDSLGPEGIFANPRQIAGSYKFLSVGFESWCAIDSSDALICRYRGIEPRPEAIPSTIVPVKVANTRANVCAIDDAQQLWCWGSNDGLQLGTGDAIEVPPETPHQIPGSFTEIELGNSAACALTTEGKLVCWGSCLDGQLGRGGDCGTPTEVMTPLTFTALAVGEGQTCVLDTEAQVHCMGTNGNGELGAKGGISSYELLDIDGFGEWTAITTGSRFSCGLRADDEAWCWGDNRFGQLGDGGGGDVLSPVAIDPGPFDSVVSGNANGCALKSGQLWCWGGNGFGQLGDGSTLERRRPVQIGTDEDWAKVSIARTQACGIRDSGTLWCWGNNSQKQLGIGGNLDVHVPTQVGSDTGWTEIAVGDEVTCGVRDTAVYCWGRNRSSMPEQELDIQASSLSADGNFFNAIDSTTGGAIGFGPFNGLAPESATVTTWSSLDRGNTHVCGLVGTELYCYGQNNEGQLGVPPDGTSPAEAVREQTNGSWQKVSVGASTTCAIDTENKLACMGSSLLNGLGKELSTDIPTTVGDKQWRDISVGLSATCGLQLDGSLHCWGLGNAAGRGDGKGGHERPTRVTPP